MLTFFTIPKPFAGHFDVIQRNAIRSWLLAYPGARVILMGDEPGTADVARDLGVEHLPDIARSDYGTPLLNDLFDRAQKHSPDRYFNYINADILLLTDFGPAFQRVVREKKRFLLVGQRIDFDQKDPIDFSPGWDDALRAQIQQQGRLHRPTGIDYFVFNRDLWGTLPPFAVGRFSWDNWMIYRARQLQVPVIDATTAITIVHQNHDYSHAAGGLKGALHGPEAKLNLALAGGQKHLFTIWDSTHVLTPQALEKRTSTGLGGGIWTYRRSSLYNT